MKKTKKDKEYSTMERETVPSPAISELVPEGLLYSSDSRQERKSAKMRETILEATLDCLARYGYANTTNNLICELAKVSRGAMLHHYPTRQDLMIAVIEYAFYKHMTAFSRAVSQLTEEDRIKRNSAVAIDWELCQSREFQAYLELRVAARTNKELRTIFLPRARHHDQVWKDELLKTFPEWRNDLRKLDLARRFLRAVLEGLVMSRELWKDTRTEWLVLGFVADITARIRRGELDFPTEENLHQFINPAMTAMTTRSVKTSKPRRRTNGKQKAQAQEPDDTAS